MVKSLFLELFLFSYYSGSRERHFQSTLPVNISLLPYEKQRQALRINNKEALAFISHFIVFSMRENGIESEIVKRIKYYMDVRQCNY